MSASKGPRVKVTLRMPPALHARLVVQALEQKTTLQALILEKLKSRLE